MPKIICIYKIYCKDKNIKDFYIGKTKNYKSRKTTHKNSYTSENDISHNKPLYKFIRNNGGWDNWDFKILKQCKLQDLDTLELEFYDKLKPTLNHSRPVLFDKLKSKSYIYKIFCKDKEVKEIYIGSTSKLNLRKNTHRYNCNNPNSKEYDRELYKFIRNNGGWDNWDYEILKEWIVDNSEDLKSEEQKFIIQHKSNNTLLNSVNPIARKRDQKKWYEKNKEEYNEKRIEKRKNAPKVFCMFCKIDLKEYCFRKHTKSNTHCIKVKNFRNQILDFKSDNLSIECLKI